MHHLPTNPASRRSLMDYRAAPVLRAEHAEGGFTRLLEQQAAKIPSHVFLFLSLGAMGVSLLLEATRKHEASQFVRMWAAPFLIMGVYNKLVKIVGPQ